MAAFYDVMEFSTAVKPWLLRTLLDRPGYDSVSYLDPDIQVFSSLQKIEDEAIKHGIVLTPHFTKPLPRDGKQPAEEDILIAGSYNLGFIGLGAGKTADELLDWWSERLENECLNDPANGHFVDQRWIDLAPSFWPDLFLLRETNYNIAYWNLPTRTLETDGDGYKVDGEPLRFFHFSGYDPRRPRELSKHQNRVKLAADPALQRICDAYGELLKESGYEEAAKWPYGWDTTANGVKIDRIAREMYRDGVDTGRFRDSIFDEAGAREFRDYLTETVEGGGEYAGDPLRGDPLAGAARPARRLPRHQRLRRRRIRRLAADLRRRNRRLAASSSSARRTATHPGRGRTCRPRRARPQCRRTPSRGQRGRLHQLRAWRRRGGPPGAAGARVARHRRGRDRRAHRSRARSRKASAGSLPPSTPTTTT